MISTAWFRKSPHVLTPTDPRKFLVIMGIICCSLVLLASDLSAQVAEITSKKLSFLKPSGREIFKPGDTVIVTWGGTPNWKVDTVQIELSGDNGVSWQSIVEVPARYRPPLTISDSAYRWIVPSVACKECLLRVRQIKGFMGAGDTVDRFNTPVNVTGVTIISGHTGDFAITSGVGPYAIAAGSSVPLGLHFVPSDTGRRAVIIEAQTEFGPVRAEIWGDGFKKTGGVEEEQHTSRSSSGLALSVRPNPATDQVTVRYTAAKSEGLNLVLFDMAGRQIDRINLGRVEPGSYEFQYDVGSVLTGVYRLELRSEREGVGQRLVVVH